MFGRAAAVVSVSGRLYCCSGGCQPDPDEHRREWDERLSSGQEDGGLEPCQCKILTRSFRHLAVHLRIATDVG